MMFFDVRKGLGDDPSDLRMVQVSGIFLAQL
jgi:hypothetical protein